MALPGLACMTRGRSSDAAGGCGRGSRRSLPYVLIAAAFVLLLLHEEARVRNAARQHSDGGHWADRTDAQSAGGVGRAAGGGTSGGGKPTSNADQLRALWRAAGQRDAAKFAEHAILQGLLPANQLAEFLNGEAGDASAALGQQQRTQGGARQGGGALSSAAAEADGDSLQDGDDLAPVRLPPLRADERPLACPLPDAADAARVARDNTVIFALVNQELLDFGVNWLRHLQRLKVGNMWVAVYEEDTAQYLVKHSVPCFDARQMIHVDPKLGFEWGQENWKAMVWGKVVIANWIMQAGFDLVLSDVDVVWFKDPTAILREHPQADLLVSTDALQTFLQPGDQGLEDPEKIWAMGTSFNTGVMLWRNTPGTRRLMRAWERLRRNPVSADGAKHFHSDQDALNDRYLRPGVDAGDSRWFNRNGDRVIWTFNRSVPMGCFPISRFATGHGYSVQRLHKVMRVEPYVLHTTYVFGKQPGKRARLREAGLWLADEPAYFDGRFLVIDLQLPEVPEAHQKYLKTGHMPWELERQIAFHTAAVEYQLGQLYQGFALAVALNRTLILPEARRRPCAHELRYPFPCPADYLFSPGNAADEPGTWGPPLHYRVAGFLGNPSLPVAVKESVTVVRPTRSLGCSDCSRRQHGSIEVPGVLDDVTARAALRQHRDIRILRFADGGAAWRGFVNSTLQAAFEKRLRHFAGTWCCRSPEAMKRFNASADIQYAFRPLSGSSLQRLEAGTRGEETGGNQVTHLSK